MSLFGTIVGGLAGLGQSLIDSRTQKRNVDMTNQANMNLAQYQYSKDLEMWNRANEYNSPSAQMARFQQAGLNPNLIYGGSVSGASGNTATSLPKYQAPQLSYNYKSPVNVMSMLSMFQDFNMKQAQTDNLKAQRKVIENQGYITSAKAVWDSAYRNLFFKYDGNNHWSLKPEFEGLFKEVSASRFVQPSKVISKYDADIKRIEAEGDFRNKMIEWFVNDKIARYLGIVGQILK